ncbi:unnamed protein product [Lactuca saligna]|uniref:Uncharacterized protein n=1 Tax=Lactuca saligna TaxID=75948 RepID=A0AA36DYK9_LACSI|nr:unnamed protein product [Lactuca saligna]
MGLLRRLLPFRSTTSISDGGSTITALVVAGVDLAASAATFLVVLTSLTRGRAARRWLELELVPIQQKKRRLEIVVVLGREKNNGGREREVAPVIIGVSWWPENSSTSDGVLLLENEEEGGGIIHLL